MAKKPTPKAPETVQGTKVHDPREAHKLVKMVRAESYPAPHAADVHPDMVDDYAAGGWERA